MVKANGLPFFQFGDTPWEAPQQLTIEQFNAYADDRKSRNFNSVIMEMIERLYTSQSPHYLNVYGDAPFTTMSPPSWTSLVSSYWQHLSRLLDALRLRGMFAWLTPAYFGYGNNANGDGWVDLTDAASDADMTTYGVNITSYLTQDNWGVMLGGDYDGTGGQRAKQNKILEGIRTVKPSILVTGHPQRLSDTYSLWNAVPGFNVNSIYIPTANTGDGMAATAYAKPGPLPFATLEDRYEDYLSMAVYKVRQSFYSSWLSGASGHFTSHYQFWSFGDATGSDGLGAAHALATWSNTVGTRHRSIAFALLKSVDWWKLVPKTGTELVTSSLGTTETDGRVCAALANDRSFGVVWKNDTNSVTVNMAAFSKSSVTAQWFDPTSGLYFTPTEGLTFSNSGTQAFAHRGNNAGGDIDWLLVLSQ